MSYFVHQNVPMIEISHSIENKCLKEIIESKQGRSIALSAKFDKYAIPWYQLNKSSTKKSMMGKQVIKFPNITLTVLILFILSGCSNESDEVKVLGTSDTHKELIRSYESPPAVVLPDDPVNYVNPFIGTDEHGHTFPGASLPFGLVQLSPDTGGTAGNWLSSAWKWCAGYHYSDTTILGFSHVHRSGMGVGDWGDILMMPTVGELKIVPGSENNPDEGYRSRFSHHQEEASPGYYAVILKDYEIKAEVTATRRVGFHRYNFPETGDAHILVDIDHGLGDTTVGGYVRIADDDRIEGYRRSSGRVLYHTVYFCAQFSRPFESYGVWKGHRKEINRKEAKGSHTAAFVNYTTSKNETILVKVGISYTSIGQARLNLQSELPGWDFDRVRYEARAAWNDELSKIEVFTDPSQIEDSKKEQMVIFYTALYHSLLFPSTFGDADGKYSVIGNIPGKIHIAEDFTYYSDFSIWDTFRAEMPLLILLQPKRVRDMIKTLIAQFKDSGWLPTPQQFGNFHSEGMLGDHSTSVILDAYVKGIRSFDVGRAYKAMWKNAMIQGTNLVPGIGFGQGRYAISYYRSIGYVPADFNVRPEHPLFLLANIYNQGTSRTLEYAYDDFCMAVMAKILGEKNDHKYFMDRSLNYRKVFDPNTGFMRGRSIIGTWMNSNDFTPEIHYSYYAEGNAWQWTWFVPHDVQGLIDLMNGRKAFVQKLDALFADPSTVTTSSFFSADVGCRIGQYIHGNEPSHHIPYLYSYAGHPWKTQESVREIMLRFYDASPNGICGNEDMGQMSAWYIFAAMGFYPFSPGIYTVGSPIFDKVVVHLAKGKDLIIEAKGVSPRNKYIQSVTLNGDRWDKSWFEHGDIIDGGILIFNMGPNKNTEWSTDNQSFPPSLVELMHHICKQIMSQEETVSR